MNDKNRKIAILIAAILGCVGLFYLGGMLGQLLGNYAAWMDSGGVSGESTMKPVNWNPLICFPAAFSGNGIKGILMILLIAGAIFAYVKLHDKFDGKQHDPRGFARSKSGIYGTASWMDEKEMKEVLEISPVPDAKGTILGEYNGKAVCMPEDTRLNRHIAIFGASGTMKSRAIIRNALFQALRRSESVIVTDSKGELYADTSEMFRNAGYDVKIYNLVSPEHSDSWNCMSDLNGDTLMAQVLTNVIIGNTSSGKGDHFWDNGEGNLLKALILLIDQDRTRSPDMKHLSAVYQLLTQNSERQLTAMFDKLPLDHPARAPFNLFAQSSDTVRSGIILGLGTRLQVLQNQAVQRITSRSDIDLTAPGRNKCIYYIVLSDQDATMAFLSSLFFSFMFIKLTRYADGRPNGRCDVPVNLILDEFNNVGRIGGAEDGSDFARSLSVVRSRDIRVMLAVQSLGQLQNRYPKNLWAEIIGNCDIQLMLGCTDDVTAEYISARSGDMSVQVNSTMTVRQTIAVAQVIPQYRHTEGQGRRRLLTPDEVLRLPNEELLCIIRGHNILKLNKLDFTRHPMAKQIVKASVYDYQSAADAYRRIKDDSCAAHVKVNVDKAGNLMRVSQTHLDSGSFTPTTVLAGEFKIFAQTGPAQIYSATETIDHADFEGQYVLNKRTFTPQETMLIPKLPEWYIIPKEVVDICKHAKATTGKSMQMRNFLLRGPAGTGKTMGAKAIAAGLGLPYMKYTCSANTEIFDFVGMIFPDSEDSTGSAQLDAERETLMQMGGINYANVSKLMKLPDLDDMDYDPAGVYMALTGVENAAATSQDCMSIVLDRVTEKVRELSKTVKDKNSSGQTYRYVETDFVKALKHGYVIEIQEPSTIVQPGVLVGLNSLLEQSGSITLPTGEVIRRHPDAVVVVTTNTSYEGCRGMNQSVLDRMSLVRDVELPSPEVMAQRAMSVTGATDEYEVSKMVQVVNDLAEYCRKNSITDGSYGMRSLIDWIISSEITGDVYESALYTIISKATADELDREALISTVLEPIFAPKRHKASA